MFRRLINHRHSCGLSFQPRTVAWNCRAILVFFSNIGNLVIRPASIERYDPARKRAGFLRPQLLLEPMSTPLIDRPEEELETALVGNEVEGRKRDIAAETLRRRYVGKGWSDWIARLRIFALQKGWLTPRP